MDNDSINQPSNYGTYGSPQPPQGVPNPPQPVQPAAMPPQQPQTPPVASPQPQRAPLRIDHNLLAELGLAALPEEEKKALEKHIYETLEMRVGMRLADQMTNEQLDEFETYFNARDDAGAFRWLETNFPNYKDIVAEEFDKLKNEVAGQAPAILAASQQQISPVATDPAQVNNNYPQQPQPPVTGQPQAPPTPPTNQQPPQTPAA